MKNTLKYLALASAMLFGFGACVEKAPEYEPADQVGNSEVFFAPNLPSTYNLKGNPGKFSFDISRVDASNSVTVSLSSSADAIFSIPSSVSFSSGSKTAPVEVTFDPSKLKEDTPYPFTVTITNETTPYGASEYSFTASIPAAWIKFAKGTMTESPDFWGETERETMYYQDIAPGVRYCYISDCFDTETVKAGDPYDPVNYYFYWYFDPEAEGAPDHAPGKLRVLPQYMGYTNSSGQMWFSDNQAFYEDYYGADYWAGSDKYTDWGDYMEKNGIYMPYYDGNGGFYLADQYYYGPVGCEKWGYGNWDLTPDEFIADGFVRITDYNDEKHIGASSALYDGTMSSMMFSSDDEPVEFDQSLRYDANYEFDPEEFDPEKDEVITTTYYLPDYFAEGRCLAFVAPIPELLENESEISDGDNEQNAGVKIMGHDLFVNIKKGSVSFPETEAVAEEGEDEEELFPTFTLVVNAYTKDADGNVDIEFGTLTEVFTALEYGKDGYTIDDIYGGYKEDYLGTWSMFATDNDGEEFNYDVEISDAGEDEEGNSFVTIRNLSGFDGRYGLEDVLTASFSNYVLFVEAQQLESPFVYGEDEYAVTVWPADPDTGKYYTNEGLTVLGGICSDGALAFVSRYSDVNLSGFYYSIESLGGLTLIGNIYGFGANGESVGKFRNFYEEAKTGRIGRGVTASVKFDSMRMVKKSASVAAPARRINVSNFVLESKDKELPGATMFRAL